MLHYSLHDTIYRRINSNFLILILLLATYFFVRLYHHEQRVNFADDQGVIAMDTYSMWQKKMPLLVGPKVSMGFEGRYFFHGPAVYYFLLPGMLVGSWHPIAGSITTIVWNSLGVVFLYLIGARLKSRLLGFLLSVIYIFNPFMIEFTSFIWNPNFLPTISIIAAYLLLASRNNWSLGKFAISKFLLLGVLIGVGLMLHYQMALVTLIVVITMLLSRQLSLKNFLTLILGIGIGISPYLLFEVRHNFYNLQTIVFIISHRLVGSQAFQVYYFFAPFLVLSLALITITWKKLNSKYRSLLLILLGITAIINVYFGIMLMNIQSDLVSFPELEKAASIILSQTPENYNVLNLTTGDTRASALRYLVTYQVNAPLGVEQYPQADKLFVVSKKKSSREIENDPVWEISSAKRTVANSWSLSQRDTYYLYLLEKNRN